MTTKLITIPLTVDPTTQYTSGDCLGTKIVYPNALSGNNKGVLKGFVMADEAQQATTMTLVIFASDPSLTTFTDNAPLDIDDADLKNIIGTVAINSGTVLTFVDNSVIMSTTLYVPLEASSPTLYACILGRSTQHYAAATDLQLKLYIEV